MFYQVQFNLTSDGAADIHIERYLRMTEMVVAGRSFPAFEEQCGESCIHLNDEGIMEPYQQWGTVPARGEQELRDVLRYLLLDRWGGEVGEVEREIEDAIARAKEDREEPVYDNEDPNARYFLLESSAKSGEQIQLVVRQFEDGDTDDEAALVSDVVGKVLFDSLPVSEVDLEESVMITRSTWAELKSILHCELTCRFDLDEAAADCMIDAKLVELSEGQYVPGQLSEKEVVQRFLSELATVSPSDFAE